MENTPDETYIKVYKIHNVVKYFWWTLISFEILSFKFETLKVLSFKIAIQQDVFIS